jgi:hypothetical protein
LRNNHFSARKRISCFRPAPAPCEKRGRDQPRSSLAKSSTRKISLFAGKHIKGIAWDSFVGFNLTLLQFFVSRVNPLPWVCSLVSRPSSTAFVQAELHQKEGPAQITAGEIRVQLSVRFTGTVRGRAFYLQLVLLSCRFVDSCFISSLSSDVELFNKIGSRTCLSFSIP